MKITRIENQKKRPGRKNIYADGKFLIGVAAETLLTSGLRTGDEITPATFHLLERREELLGAKNAALRYLSIRPRTEREIRDKLREKEFGEEEIAEAIAGLTKAGLLDDSEFARTFIRTTMALRPAGKALLKRKLLLLGVERETVDAALSAELEGNDQEAAAARAAAAFLQKTARGMKEEAPAKLKQRLTAYLLRRGYSWEVIAPVVKGAIHGDDDGGNG